MTLNIFALTIPILDWEFDAESYLPPPTADSDLSPSTFTYKPKINNSRRSLYYLTSPSEIQGDGSSKQFNIMLYLEFGSYQY